MLTGFSTKKYFKYFIVLKEGRKGVKEVDIFNCFWIGNIKENKNY